MENLNKQRDFLTGHPVVRSIALAGSFDCSPGEKSTKRFAAHVVSGASVGSARKAAIGSIPHSPAEVIGSSPTGGNSTT